MTIDEIADVIGTIKKSGSNPIEFLDAKIQHAETQVQQLKQVRSIFAPPEEKARKVWIRRKKTDAPEMTAPVSPPSAGESIATRIARAVADRPMRVADITALGICSDPTVRNNLKSPHFVQMPDGKWTVTVVGRSHFFGPSASK